MEIAMDEDGFSLDRIVRIRVVLERTGLSRSTIYRKMQEGTFPQTVKLSGHMRGWREAELNRWIADPVMYKYDSFCL